MGRIISISDIGLKHNPLFGIYALSIHWQRMGLKPHIDFEFYQDAALCLLHHDLTRLDATKIPTAPADVRVVNGRALELSLIANTAI
jgi:hypothetical protein